MKPNAKKSFIVCRVLEKGWVVNNFKGGNTRCNDRTTYRVLSLRECTKLCRSKGHKVVMIKEFKEAGPAVRFCGALSLL